MISLLVIKIGGSDKYIMKSAEGLLLSYCQSRRLHHRLAQGLIGILSPLMQWLQAIERMSQVVEMYVQNRLSML